jgi:hypothetical protein
MIITRTPRPNSKLMQGRKVQTYNNPFPSHYDSLLSLSIVAKAGRMFGMKQKDPLLKIDHAEAT